MDLVVEGNQQKLTVKIIGELTADTCADLREAVHSLAGRRPQAIVVDLAEMGFIDSMGLGALVGLRGAMKKQGCELTVCNPQDRVLQILQLTKIAPLFGLPEA